MIDHWPAGSDQPLLIRVLGPDQPQAVPQLLEQLARSGAVLEDMEQVVVRGRLTCDVLVRLEQAHDGLLRDLVYWGFLNDLAVDFERVDRPAPVSAATHAITVLGRSLRPAALAAVAEAVVSTGGTIDRIVQVAVDPVAAYEVLIGAGDLPELRSTLVGVAQDHGVDIAVQAAGLERRAKRLIVMDVDSTLIQDEVIDLLATEAGCAEQVKHVTDQTMRGELDFEQSLRARVRLLKGLDLAAVERARERIRLTPGARTFVRTLRRLGYTVAIVSGGFTPFTDWLQAELSLDHAYANTLEIIDGRLTGEVLGTIIDRAGKAAVLRRIATEEGIPLSQTVAIGDGANDLDMIAAAGLGIAFNAKPVVRQLADATLSVPYLDAILFMLGIRGNEVARTESPVVIN